MASNKSKIEMTRFTVSGSNLVGDPATERIATAVKSEPIFLLLSPMTSRAMSPKQGLYLTHEVDFGSLLGEYPVYPKDHQNHGEETVIPHTTSKGIALVLTRFQRFPSRQPAISTGDDGPKIILEMSASTAWTN